MCQQHEEVQASLSGISRGRKGSPVSARWRFCWCRLICGGPFAVRHCRRHMMIIRLDGGAYNTCKVIGKTTATRQTASAQRDERRGQACEEGNSSSSHKQRNRHASIIFPSIHSVTSFTACVLMNFCHHQKLLPYKVIWPLGRAYYIQYVLLSIFSYRYAFSRSSTKDATALCR